MKQFIFLLVLAGGSHAFIPIPDTKCDANKTTSPCFPVVGGSVYIKLLTNATGYKLQCLKRQNKTHNLELISLKREKVKLADAYKNRAEFSISTGTLKIINVERNDTGQYIVESYDKDGKRETDIHFTLEVKENILHILAIACIVAAGVILFIVVVICCICCRKSRRSQAKAIDVLYENGL